MSDLIKRFVEERNQLQRELAACRKDYDFLKGQHAAANQLLKMRIEERDGLRDCLVRIGTKTCAGPGQANDALRSILLECNAALKPAQVAPLHP